MPEIDHLPAVAAAEAAMQAALLPSGRADTVTRAAYPVAALSCAPVSALPFSASPREWLVMHPDTWPLRSCLELGALPSAVPCARLHSRQVLWEWKLDSLSKAAELLVSELVTNAVQAAAGREIPVPIRLRLSSDKTHVLIEVWDADPKPPKPKTLDAGGIPPIGDEGGRGLFLVDTLSEHWGWYPMRESSGKVVWAEVAG
jgi:anti-sigma regulatory factor (Ser/Thr protein kinase)